MRTFANVLVLIAVLAFALVLSASRATAGHWPIDDHHQAGTRIAGTRAPTRTPQPPTATPTATPEPVSVPGSTDGIVVMGMVIVLIILLPVLLQWKLWLK